MLTLIALVFIPGFLVALAGRVSIGYAAVGAVPISYGIVTIATYTLGKLGMPWNLGAYIVATVVAAVVIGIVALIFRLPWRQLSRHRRRRARHRRRKVLQDAAAATDRDPELRSADPQARGLRRFLPRIPPAREWVWFLVPTAAVCASAWAIGTMVLNELAVNIDGVKNIFQGWDAHWHVNYLRFIAETGIASPDQAGILRNPESHAGLYYPSSWHAIAGLVYSITGVGAPETYNLVQVGCAALFFPLGVAALAFAMTRRRFGLAVAGTAATAGALLTPLFPSLPFVEIMVAATPSAAAMGLMGASVFLIFAAVRRPLLILPAALSLVGVGGIHPSGLATAAIVVILYWLFELLWRPEHGRFRDLLPLATIAVLGALTLVPQFLSISAEADDISAFEFQTGEARGATWANAALLQVRHVKDWGVRWVLLAVVIVGLIALLSRLLVWPVLAYAGFLVVCVNAMSVFGTSWGGWLRAVGSIYYNDPRRIGVVMAILAAAVAGLGVAAVAQGLVALLAKLIDPITDPRHHGAGGLQVAAALAAAVACASWAVQTAPEYAVAAGNNQRWDLLIDSHDRRAFDWLATQPDAYDGLIFSNPDEGSGWMYATNGLPSTARHYLAPPKEEVNTIHVLWNVDKAGRSPKTDKAIKDLNLKYVYVSPPSYWPWQKPIPAQMEAAKAPGLELIYVDRQIRIYAVKAAFSPQQLQGMVNSSPYPPGKAQNFTRASETGY